MKDKRQLSKLCLCINCFEIVVFMMIRFCLWIVHAPDADDSLGPGLREHPFPALACRFRKDLTPFRMAQRRNEEA